MRLFIVCTKVSRKKNIVKESSQILLGRNCFLVLLFNRTTITTVCDARAPIVSRAKIMLFKHEKFHQKKCRKYLHLW